jgi:hypothetical protein
MTTGHSNSAGFSDIILICSLLCLSADSITRWEQLDACQRPVHEWLVASYLLVLTSRLLQLAGIAVSAPGTEEMFLLNLRPQELKLRVLTYCTWIVNLPVHMACAMRGTFLICAVRLNPAGCSSSPQVQPFLFVIVWQALSYLWVVMHARLAFAAWRLEWRLRAAEAELHQLESPDVLSRWGRVSTLTGPRSLFDAPVNEGLSATEISKLPSEVWRPAAGCDGECSICIETLLPGDCVRRMGCGHTFHKSCIDLWLLRRADCPLCKCEVTAISNGDSWGSSASDYNKMSAHGSMEC